jgi:2-amino-4-hydroxy-6-hydroxymethyldihydropteridine diphosphokinase
MRAGIALGSNLGDRLANLQRARAHIFALAPTQPPLLQSCVYETAPVNCEPGARNFYNSVIEIGFQASPEQLLQALQQIEEELGRGGEHARNVSRTIDLDLLYFGELQREGQHLQLPHPRMAEREFVLRPLADLVPDLRLPGQAATVRELLRSLNSNEIPKCVMTEW